MSRKIVLAACVASALVLSGCATTPQAVDTSPPAEKENFVIGLVSDQSGPGAAWNAPANEVIRVLVDQLNADGGLLGMNVTIAEANHEGDPAKVPTAMNRVIGEGASVIFHHASGNAVIAGKTVSAEAQIPTIASTNSNAAVPAPPDNEFTYTLATPSTVWASTYCAGMKAAGIKTLGVVLDDTPAMASFSQALLPALDCVEVVAKEQSAADGSNVSSSVARVASANPDAVLVLSAGTAFEIQAYGALAQQMPDVPRFATAALGNTPSEWGVIQPKVLDGLIFMGAIDNRNPKTIEATKEMEKLIKDFVMTQFTAEAYDAFWIMVEAVEKAGSADPIAINNALQTITKYPSAMGVPGFTISFGPEKHLGADSNCGLILQEFGPNGKPLGVWEHYTPNC